MLRREVIASFNPFNMSAFRCPVCGSNDFVELYPYGGVWCAECNAEFSVRGTDDGVNKIVVDCFTKWVWKHKRRKDLPEYFWTVIWRGDDRISWLAWTGEKIIEV